MDAADPKPAVQGFSIITRRSTAGFLGPGGQGLVEGCGQVCRALQDHQGGGGRLGGPGDSELDKAKKLYEAVQALDNTDYSRKKSATELKELKLKEAKRAEDTWAQKSGSSEDIALLYLAMVRAAGLTAYAMESSGPRPERLRSQLLEIEQFDDTIVILASAARKFCSIPARRCVPSEL